MTTEKQFYAFAILGREEYWDVGPMLSYYGAFETVEAAKAELEQDEGLKDDYHETRVEIRRRNATGDLITHLWGRGRSGVWEWKTPTAEEAVYGWGSDYSPFDKGWLARS